jgi:phenylacetate-CoA ligase
MIILRGVNLFPTQIEELILGIDGLAAHFELVLTRPHRLDELTVRAEARLATSAADRVHLANRLQQRVKDNIGVSCQVDIIDPDTLPRSAGKAIRVVDQRRA